ncbi:MAG TPA: hypothetical protein VKE74_34825 [Gemmataceae bacterium]|nr:hypothetical protein [Gemmataceae bacterium]
MRRVLILAACLLAVAGGCRKKTQSTDPDKPKPPEAGPGKDSSSPGLAWYQSGGRKPEEGAGNSPDRKAPSTTVPFFEFTSPDGRFQAAFPLRQPTQRPRTQQTPFGTINDTAFEVDEGKWSVLVAVGDWDTPQLKGVNLEQVADTGRDTIAKALRTRVASEQRTTSNGIITRHIVFEFQSRPAQGPAYFRYVIHGRRLYTLAILINGATVADADRDRFFDSFKINR